MKVRIYNDISVPGEGLKYIMLSVYLVHVKIYNAISVHSAG